MIFLTLAAACLAPLFPLPAQVGARIAPGALIGGTLAALQFGNPFRDRTKQLSRWLLQASVILLGFSMDISKIAQAGRSGLILSLASIGAIFALGAILRRTLRVRPITSLLVSAGTAICGGSAIAAMSTVVEAPEEDVSVAVGTVFLLNALALVAFPPIGHVLHLSQRSFGAWSGIAIHDIASVVGAGQAYGAEALDVATAVKLSRVLYLVPITFLAALIRHRRSPEIPAGERPKPQVPWFVAAFLVASIVRTVVPATIAYTGDIKRLAAAGFALSLFLIGSALTRSTLKSVGLRPLLLGSVLWLFVSVASLVAVTR